MLNEKNYKIELKVFEENSKNVINDMFSSLEKEVKEKTEALNKELNKKLLSKFRKSVDEELNK